MPLTIAHTSDLHGRFHDILWRDSRVPDVWVTSGDFCPNFVWRSDRAHEHVAQRAWLRENTARLREVFRGKPVLVVDGNHDFLALGPELRTMGIEAIDIPLDGMDFMGHRWAGFPDIPYIDGRWNHESSDALLRRTARRSLESGADILVTHAPPASILSGPWGIPMTSDLMYMDHKVKHHLFGHVHEFGGQTALIRDMTFINSAETVTYITL